MIAERRLVIIAYLFLFFIPFIQAAAFYETFDGTINTSFQAGKNYTNMPLGTIHGSYKYNATFLSQYTITNFGGGKNPPTQIHKLDFLDNPNWFFFVAKDYENTGTHAFTSYVYKETNTSKVNNNGLSIYTNYSGTYATFDGFANPFNRLVYLFNETQDLNLNSRIAFTLFNDSNAAIIFRTDDTNDTFILAAGKSNGIAGSGGDCQWAGTTDFNKEQCCGYFNDSKTQKSFNFTIRDVINVCNNSRWLYKPVLKDITNIRQVIVQFVADDDPMTKGSIDDLYIGFTTDGDGLPTINSFNITSDDCINNSKSSSITVNYELDVTDPENDDLWYSTGEWDQQYNYNYFKYSTHTQYTLPGIISVVTGETLDNDILGYIVYPNNNTCRVYPSPLFPVDALNNYFGFVQQQGLTNYDGDDDLDVGYDIWALNLDSSTCYGDLSFTYALPNPVQETIYRSDFWNLGTNGEKMNITYWSATWDRINTININNVNNVLNVSYVDASGNDVFMFNMSNWYTFAVQIYNNTFQIWDVAQTELQENETFYQFSNQSIKYITIGIGPNTKIQQGGFSHSGMADVLSWSQDVPTTIPNVHRDFYTCIYVTDTMHKDINDYVYDCVTFTPQICDASNVDSNTLGGNPIVTPLKNIFSPIIDGFGMRSVIDNMNWLVFLILFIGIFLLTHSFGITFLSSVFIMLFFSLIGFGSVTHIIIYSVMLALGLTPYIVQMLFPIQRGGG